MKIGVSKNTLKPHSLTVVIFIFESFPTHFIKILL